MEPFARLKHQLSLYSRRWPTYAHQKAPAYRPLLQLDPVLRARVVSVMQRSDLKGINRAKIEAVLKTQ